MLNNERQNGVFMESFQMRTYKNNSCWKVHVFIYSLSLATGHNFPVTVSVGNVFKGQ